MVLLFCDFERLPALPACTPSCNSCCCLAASPAQVAPLVAGLQDRLRTLLAARTHTSVYNRHDDLAAVKVHHIREENANTHHNAHPAVHSATMLWEACNP
jgi:hypothetical protein